MRFAIVSFVPLRLAYERFGMLADVDEVDLGLLVVGPASPSRSAVRACNAGAGRSGIHRPTYGQDRGTGPQNTARAGALKSVLPRRRDFEDWVSSWKIQASSSSHLSIWHSPRRGLVLV